MLPFLPAVPAVLSNLPWAKIILYSGMVLMGITIYVLVQINAANKLTIKSQTETIQTKENQILEKNVKILEISRAAEQYQKSCKATIKALDKINTYEAKKSRDLENQISRIQSYDESKNGIISPALRDALELLK